MEGLLRMEDGDQVLPFVRCFYGSPSTYLWEDELGKPQVWRGNSTLDEAEQGVMILGIPVGQPGFVRRFLEKKSEEQKLLFDRIPVVPDVQSAWLILLMCASTRANFWLMLCGGTRCTRMGVLAPNLEGSCCGREVAGHSVAAVRPRRVGTHQRCQGQGRGPLGELGRLFADGPPTPSHFGRDYD